MKKEVLLIFKTHLDIGFTGYARDIIRRYIDEFIPNAIRVGYELKDTDTPFIWTVGSWLLWRALNEDHSGKVEKAIRDGILNWHALPFTTHTELMSPRLFEFGVSLSKKLDKRFGRETVGAKMTDVPGHTKGMIPILKRNGVRFLHLGVNPATPVPPVPPLFRWKCGKDEILVMYEKAYGEVADFDNFTVYFAHTGDNLGPQCADDIRKVYREAREKYPDAVIKAASIDDIARRMETLEGLPVFEGEIGDTWIHGAATDPEKLSRYRRVLRHIESRRILPDALADHLLLVPEHTWGMDVKKFFPDTEHFTHHEMERVKAERHTIEESWREQRAFVERAERFLGLEAEYPVQEPSLDGFEKIDLPDTLPYEVSFELFDRSDYERYEKAYVRCKEPWATWDFTKVGLPEYKGGIFTARVSEAYEKEGTLLYRLDFDRAAREAYGLPYFWLKKEGEALTLSWFGKKPSRLPQAFWFKIDGLTQNLRLHKMGEWLRPDSVIGSPLISAIDEGIRADGVKVKSLDAALVAPYGRRLLRYGEKAGECDPYFLLYDNIWNTNFPMWYEGDALFRFEIIKEK